MEVLILEDDDGKFARVVAEISAIFAHKPVMCRAESWSTGTKLLYEKSFDLIVADLMMPNRKGDDATDISDDFLSVLQLSEKNKGTNAIVLGLRPIKWLA